MEVLLLYYCANERIVEAGMVKGQAAAMTV